MICLLQFPGANVVGCGRLAAATLESLTYDEVKLTQTLPLHLSHSSVTEPTVSSPLSLSGSSTQSPPEGWISANPQLLEHMIERSVSERQGGRDCTFTELLDQLLNIVVLPIKNQIRQVRTAAFCKS